MINNILRINIKNILGKRMGLFIVTLLFWTIGVVNITKEPPDMGGDSTQYIIIAQSLASGHGFRMVNYPSAPLSKIAPLLPFVLSIAFKVCGENLVCFRFLILCFGYGALVVFLRLFQRTFKYAATSLFFLLSLFLSKLFFVYNFRVLTDMPFLFFISVAFLCFEKYKHAGPAINKYGVFAVLFFQLAYFCRYIGILAFISVIIYLFVYDEKPNKKKAAFMILFFLPLPLIWGVRNLLINDANGIAFLKQFTYVDWYRPYLGTILQKPFLLLQRILNNLLFYFLLLGNNFFFSFLSIRPPLIAQYLFSFLAGGLLIKGILMRKDILSKNLLIFSILYLGSIVIWPFQEDGRYFLPLLPFATAYIWLGIENIARQKIKILYIVFLLFILLRALAVYSMVLGLLPYYHTIPYSAKNFLHINKWIKNHIMPGEIIASRKPRITYFYSGHKSLVYPFSKDPAFIWRFLERHRIKYLIVDNFSRETYLYLAPFLQKYRARLKLIYRIGNTGLFRIE